MNSVDVIEDLGLDILHSIVEGTNFASELRSRLELVRAWESLKDTPLANQVEWLQYVDDAVSTHGLKHAQAAISARVVDNIGGAKVNQTTADLDALYDNALEAKDELVSITDNIANNTEGTAGFRPDYDEDGNFLNGLKARYRAEQKIAEYEAEGLDGSYLVDIAGSKIIYETLDEFYFALNYISTNYGGIVVRIKDRVVNPVPSGYRDVLMNVELSNQHIAELRLHLRAIEDVAAIEHALYREKREILNLAIIEGRELTPQEVARVAEIEALTQDMYTEPWNSIILNNN